MGREIRRVPPYWEHPKSKDPNREYEPLFDQDYASACEEWKKDYPEEEKPNRDCFLEERDPDKLTWYQLYETVSEGTPVSPPFKTKQELIDYLVINGDFWAQENPEDYAIPTKEEARILVDGGYAPSLMA